MDKQAVFNLRLVANTNHTREKGLMFSKPLDEDEAALFVFPYNGRYAFWNKNVDYDLSLAFLDENMKVVAIKDLKANSLSPVGPDDDVRFVIEAKQGIFTKIGINMGDIAHYNTNNTITVKKITEG